MRPFYKIIISSLLLYTYLTSVSAADATKLSNDCMDCHGDGGASTDKDVPIIGGLSEYYLIDSMLIYKDKGRPCHEDTYEKGTNKGKTTTMCEIASALSKADIEAIAKVFASKPFVRAKQPFDAGKAASGEKTHDRHCKKCHEDGGSSRDDDAGILAGQWTPYLKQTFDDYSSGKRDMPKKMKKKYEKLSASDIEELLHYYASFK